MTGAERRPPTFGPEPWATLRGNAWCHFDRWFALTAVVDFDGDLDALRRELLGRLSALQGRRDVEAKLSHLADLRTRLAAAGIDARALTAAEEADRAMITKARRKVLDQALEDRAMTDAMRDTPAARLERRARYGHWDRFPINPERWREKLGGPRPTSDVSGERSFGITRRLAERLARFDGPRRPPADRLALYRAFHTVGMDLAEVADDSYGDVGELRFDAFRTYVGLDWTSTGMEPGDYWQDLCELLACEKYALTSRHPTLPFQHVPAGQASLIERTLLDLADEWRIAYQDYEADEALQLIAWLHVAGRRYTHYVEAARRLGSQHWMPVAALAESALAGARPGLAVEVFRAADQPGWHRDHLRRQCAELTGVDIGEGSRHLRVVESPDRRERGRSPHGGRDAGG